MLRNRLRLLPFALLALAGCQSESPPVGAALAPVASPHLGPAPHRPLPHRPALPNPVKSGGGGITRTVVSLDWTLDSLRPVPTPVRVRRVSLAAAAQPAPEGPQTSLAAATLTGSVDGASFAPPAGAVTVQVDAQLNGPDIVSSSGFLISLYLEASYDGGLTFQAIAVVGWTSGPGSVLLGTTTPAGPGVAVAGPGNSTLPTNALFRARVDSPQSLYFGATVTYFDVNGNVL
jgi:hypothetical protein